MSDNEKIANLIRIFYLLTYVTAGFVAIMIAYRLRGWDIRDRVNRSRYLILLMQGTALGDFVISLSIIASVVYGSIAAAPFPQLLALFGGFVLNLSIVIFGLYIYNVLNGIPNPAGKQGPAPNKDLPNQAELIQGIVILSEQIAALGGVPDYTILGKIPQNIIKGDPHDKNSIPS